MLNRICTLLALAAVSGLAWSSVADWVPEPTAAWPAGPGTGSMELRGDYLPDFGIELRRAGQSLRERQPVELRIEESNLWLFMPFGNFEGFSGGEIRLSSELSLHHGDRALPLKELRLIPAEQFRVPVLQLIDSKGRHLANITHIHLLADPAEGRVAFRNADITATEILAELLDQPDLAGMPIGMLWLDLALEVPAGADISGRGMDFSGRGLSCEGRPLWPQDGHEVDVQLTSINFIVGQGFEPDTGRLKIAPSATLRNFGEADVPWFRQFAPADASFYPFEPRDQHPFLVWNLYRIMDGRIEQLAASGVKHAFFTINNTCALNCDGTVPQSLRGHVLWPGCLDVYSSGTNDLGLYLAPRSEVSPSLGLWDSCGSFFDPNCTGQQTGNAGLWQHRLLVDPAELDHGNSGAQYFLDAWYVIQFDVDIWNTMGYHQIFPAAGGSGGYTFSHAPFFQGPPVSRWVAENSSDPLSAHRIITVPSLSPDEPYPFNMPQGHLRVLARAEEAGDGLWRYRYAVMNFDFDRGIESFVVPLPSDAALLETWMGGPPDVLPSPWAASRAGGQVEFRSEAGKVLPWFTLYNFELLTDAAPESQGGVLMGVPGCAEPGSIQTAVPAPGPMPSGGRIFQDRFEEC
ncbi:MAG: hypothetical protein JJU31_11750 [Wenzhouxiangella sp.]|nr:hypothetical protein [Wenzhouxiangella sp.]TVR98065.1 MAG: hypothetical protein EA418_02090 [Wenzhouxiangellaceae bacterium]